LQDKRVLELQHEIKLLKADMEAQELRHASLSTAFNSLRQSVNRKIAGGKKNVAAGDEDEDEEENNSKDPYRHLSREERAFLESTIEWQQMQKYNNQKSSSG